MTVTALCPGPTESGFQKTASAMGNKIFNKHLPTAREVAEYGYESLMKGKTVAIHGWTNAIMASSIRLMPRWLIVKIVRILQESR